ncbi:hypothetical protein ES705_36155 [subsurface metagenome]
MDDSVVRIDYWDVEFEMEHLKCLDSTLAGTLKWYETSFHPDKVLEALEKEYGPGGG